VSYVRFKIIFIIEISIPFLVIMRFGALTLKTWLVIKFLFVNLIFPLIIDVIFIEYIFVLESS
jgi:hypothetical protein